MPTLRTTRLLFGLTLLLPLLLCLAACEDSDDKELATSQACINTATAANVDSCLTAIANQTTPASYALRCAADFIAQGFDTSRYTDAFQDLKTNTTGTNPTLTAVGFLAFDTSLSTHTAADAMSDCTLSQADSYRRIAEFAQYATTMAGTATAWNPSSSPANAATNASSAMQANIGDASVETSIGNQTQNLYQDFCVTQSPFSNTDVCTTLEKYKDLSSPQDVGVGILCYLSNSFTSDPVGCAAAL